MEHGQADTMVIKDEAGAYYLLPLERLQQGSVPADQTAEVERLIAEQHDVQGHASGLLTWLTMKVLDSGVGEAIARPLSLDSIAEQMRGR